MIAALLSWLIFHQAPIPSQAEIDQLIAEQSPFGGKA